VGSLITLIQRVVTVRREAAEADAAEHREAVGHGSKA
jgi:CDP-diacylglycerol--glycerol-3-phosphate 3-phosphatidyltransferase